MGPEVDEWRESVLDLLEAGVEPALMLMLLAAFALGLVSVKAVV